MYVYVCKDSAAPAHAHTRAHRPAAPRQSSGVSQTPHLTACPQAGIPHSSSRNIHATAAAHAPTRAAPPRYDAPPPPLNLPARYSRIALFGAPAPGGRNWRAYAAPSGAYPEVQNTKKGARDRGGKDGLKVPCSYL